MVREAGLHLQSGRKESGLKHALDWKIVAPTSLDRRAWIEEVTSVLYKVRRRSPPRPLLTWTTASSRTHFDSKFTRDAPTLNARHIFDFKRRHAEAIGIGWAWPEVMSRPASFKGDGAVPLEYTQDDNEASPPLLRRGQSGRAAPLDPCYSSLCRVAGSVTSRRDQAQTRALQAIIMAVDERACYVGAWMPVPIADRAGL